MGKKFVSPEIQEELGIMSPEVRAKLAAGYRADAPSAPSGEATPLEAAPPGQTALFNHWEDAVECARCGGRMVRTGSCYTCRDCGTKLGVAKASARAIELRVLRSHSPSRPQRLARVTYRASHRDVTAFRGLRSRLSPRQPRGSLVPTPRDLNTYLSLRTRSSARA